MIGAAVIVGLSALLLLACMVAEVFGRIREHRASKARAAKRLEARTPIFAPGVCWCGDRAYCECEGGTTPPVSKAD
jgi:hypothetical protein